MNLASIETPLGTAVVGATDDALCLFEFQDTGSAESRIAELRQLGHETGENRIIKSLRAELDQYFRGERRDFTLPLDISGTPFEERVWQELRQIPYGETRSYEDLAVASERPRAQRAVGRANGRNRICIVIPCHRVVRKGGQLGGYSAGLWRKEALLTLERTGSISMSSLAPKLL